MKFGRAVTYVLTAVAALYFILALVVLFSQNIHSFSSIAPKSRTIVQLGSEAAQVVGSVRQGPLHEGTLEIYSHNGRAAAEWNINIGMFRAILASADVRACRLIVDVVPLYKPRRAATVRVQTPSVHHSLALVGPGMHRFQPAMIELATTQTESLATAPLTKEALLAPGTLHVRLDARDIDIAVRRIGVNFIYDPQPAAPWNRAGVIIPLAIGEFAIFAALFVAVLRQLRYAFGIWTVPVCVTVAGIAFVTHDNWDFSLWLHFIDTVYFGGANPAGDWSATPLWSYVPALVTPIVATAPLLHLPVLAVETVALKTLFLLAFLSTWASLTVFARRANVPPLVPIAASLPFALYMLAFGTRDIFSVAAVLFGVLILERKPILAGAAFGVAISISEYFAPFFLVPALAAGMRGTNSFSVRKGIAASALSIGIVALQWVLIEATQRHDVLAFRIGSVMFAGATWPRVLAMQHIAEGIERIEVLRAGYVAYLLGGLGLLVQALRRRKHATDLIAVSLRFAVPASVLFFFCYRGVDPQEWYGPALLFAAAACYLRRSFLPAVAVSIFAFLATYSFSGFRAYLSPVFAVPSIDSLFWRDPNIMNAYTAAVLFILAIEGAGIAFNARTVDRFSPYLIGAAIAAVPAVYLRDVPLDAVLIACLLLPPLVCAVHFNLHRNIESRETTGPSLAFAFALLSSVILPLLWGPVHLGAATVIVAGWFAVCGAATVFAMRRLPRLTGPVRCAS